MKGLISALWLASNLAAGAAWAQPYAPNELGVTMGHWHLNSRDVEDRYELLTLRERQIYQLLAEGHGNKEIAQHLSLSLHTVETHRVRIMEKMDVHSAAELVLSAVRRGLIS